MDIRGRQGKLLNDYWGEEPTAYLGITIPEFPNVFCMYGPGTNLAHGGSLIFHSECQITYIMGCLEQILDGDHRMMEPRPEIHDAYNAHRKSEIDQMVWSHWSIPPHALQEHQWRRIHPVALADPHLPAVDQGP